MSGKQEDVGKNNAGKKRKERSSHTFTFIFRAFSRHFYPKRLKYICHKRVKKYITVGAVRMFIAKAPIIARLTHSLYATKVAKMLHNSTITKFENTVIAYIKCQGVQHTTRRRGGTGWLCRVF